MNNSMALHRFLYKVCWKTRLLVPLLFFVCLVAMVILLLGHDGHFEYTAEGRLRIQYANGKVENRHEKWVRDDWEPSDGLLPPMAHDGSMKDLVQKYLDANKQNALLFKANLTKDFETDPLLTKPWLDKIYVVTNSSGNKKKQHRKVKVKPGRYEGLFFDKRRPPEEFLMWKERMEKFCDGKFVGYMNEVALLKDVLVDKANCHLERQGGEFLEDVVNQSEDMEYVRFDMGCFQMECPMRPEYFFEGENHLNKYLMALQTKNTNQRYHMAQNHFTIAITRYEYANIYHTMTDWYNAFLVMQFFNKTQAETNILVLDAHPRGVLDPVWPVLFNSVTRLSYLPPRTLFSEMAWGLIGYNSPMMRHYSMDLPLVEEFRSFFLSSFRIRDRHRLNCNALKVLFVWRRDYVAHPRNPAGTVSRKVQNEREILEVIQRKYRNFHVTGIQIDLFGMQQQLRFISSSDITIGMHGAGLTHALFLPKKASLIELLPSYWSVSNDHFSAIANWRSLYYQRWVNEDPENEEPNQFTHVPPSVIELLVENAIGALCHADTYVPRNDPGLVDFPSAIRRPVDQLSERSDDTPVPPHMRELAKINLPPPVQKNFTEDLLQKSQLSNQEIIQSKIPREKPLEINLPKSQSEFIDVDKDRMLQTNELQVRKYRREPLVRNATGHPAFKKSRGSRISSFKNETVKSKQPLA